MNHRKLTLFYVAGAPHIPGFRIPTEKYIAEKNIFCCNDIGKSRGEFFFEIQRLSFERNPFELPAN